VRGTDAEERGLTGADAATIIDAMAATPPYVDRPFVRTDKGAALCRPQDKVRDLL
jgi:arsenate reductase (glutaredoxin)